MPARPARALAQFRPEKARLTLFPGFGERYCREGVTQAGAEYVALAKRWGIRPSQMAIAFVRSRWFTASTIIGATTLAQLKEDLEASSIELNAELFTEIDAIHAHNPSPAAGL